MKKYSIGIIIALIIMIIGSVNIINLNRKNYSDDIKRSIDDADIVWQKLGAGQFVIQSFKHTDKQINKLAFSLERLKMEEGAIISMQVLNREGEVICGWEPFLNGFESDEMPIVLFFSDKENEVMTQGEIYYLRIGMQNTDSDDLIAVPIIKKKNKDSFNRWAGKLRIADQEINDSILRMELYTAGYIENLTVTTVVLSLYVIISAFSVFLCNYIWINFKSKMLYFLIEHKKAIGKLAVLFIIIGFLLAYHILIDTILVFFLLVSSYSSGSLLLKKWRHINYYSYICTGVGLCFLGVIIYYILAMGLGSKEIYLILLLIPILCSRKTIIDEAKHIHNKIREKDWKYVLCILVLFGFCLALGAAPIEASDAMAKHLPISIYAADNGVWYDNIIEDIVAYSESTLLPYTYSTLFISYSCYKAFQLLNVFLFFIIYGMIASWGRRLYEKWDKKCDWLWMIVYFSSPYLLNLSTLFMVDFIAIYIVVNLLLCVCELEERSIIEKLPIIAFLAGCSVFTKLTILSLTFCMGIITAVMTARYLFKKSEESFRVKIFFLGKKLIISMFVFVIPFIFSFCKNWYMTGNPFSITAYNEIFQSPYYLSVSFDRPFQNSGLADGIKSFWNIVFHTDNMVEAKAGAMGYFLLLAYLIPLAVIISRNLKVLLWTLIMFATLQIGGIISGNMRYSLVPIICMELLTVIGVEILCKYLKRKAGGIVIGIVMVFMLVFNVSYILENFNFSNKLKPNKNITVCLNKEVLDKVPEGSRVLAFNDDQKGDFRGFYYSVSWRNEYSLHNIYNGERNLEDLLKGFDYALYKKNVAATAASYNLLIDYAKIKKSNIWESVYENEYFILYKINKMNSSEVLLEDDDYAILARNSRIEIEADQGYDEYRLHVDFDEEIDYPESEIVETHSLITGYQKNDAKKLLAQTEKLNDKIPEVIAEIHWKDQEGNLLKWQKVMNKIYPMESGFDTGWLLRPQDAAGFELLLINEDDTDRRITNMVLEGIRYNSFLDELIDEYYNRVALQNEWG